MPRPYRNSGNGSERLTEQQEFSGLNKIPALQAVKIHAACQAFSIEFHLIASRLEIVIHQRSHFPSQHIIHNVTTLEP